jgi:hypothetical protein
MRLPFPKRHFILHACRILLQVATEFERVPMVFPFQIHQTETHQNRRLHRPNQNAEEFVRHGDTECTEKF